VCSIAFPDYRAPAAEISGVRFAVILPVPRHFTILYPDDSKGNVNTAQRNDMLLAGEIQPTADRRTFKFVGRPIVLKAFADLRKIIPGVESNLLQRFYPGTFADRVVGFVFDGERSTYELLESPPAMALRLGIG
jgi:hypothetical protein